MNTLYINNKEYNLTGDKREYADQWSAEIVRILENSIFSASHEKREDIVHVWVRVLKRSLSDNGIMRLFEAIEFKQAPIARMVYAALFGEDRLTRYSPHPFHIYAVRIILLHWEMLGEDVVGIESALVWGLLDYVHAVLSLAGKMPHYREHYHMLKAEKSTHERIAENVEVNEWANRVVMLQAAT